MCFSIFLSGVYPGTRTKSIIVLIHKRGFYHSADNYRGISLTSVFSKIFIDVLNDRLNVWSIYMNNIITEEQAGFRKGYLTIDNGFILHVLIQKYVPKK